jgi:predicted amino acid racemase
LLLDVALRRNPEMIAAAIQLHQEGAIPAGSQMIDLDAVAENGATLAKTADETGLRVFVMTKQNGHNPHMTRVLLNQGLPSVVAVEALQAPRIHRYGFPLGHVGHLANIPRHEVARIVAMRPEFITVYNTEAARRVSQAANALDLHQDLYVRVQDPKDKGTFDGTVGGWTFDECVAGVRPILDLPNVTVAGLTQHCVIDYTEERDPEKARPTEAFFTALRAKELLERKLGLEDLRINTAGNANSITMPMLASYGATDVEPGMALTGEAPFHAWRAMPEKPAQVIVSEVLHRWQDEVYAVGGTFNYVWDLPGHALGDVVGLVGATFDEAVEQRVTWRPFRASSAVVDYHGVFGPPGAPGAVGDTIAVVHHPQAQTERGNTVGVSGISRGEPKVTGIFDSAVNPIDRDFAPIPLPDALQTLDEVSELYPGRRSAVGSSGESRA